MEEGDQVVSVARLAEKEVEEGAANEGCGERERTSFRGARELQRRRRHEARGVAISDRATLALGGRERKLTDIRPAQDESPLSRDLVKEGGRHDSPLRQSRLRAVSRTIEVVYLRSSRQAFHPQADKPNDGSSVAVGGRDNSDGDQMKKYLRETFVAATALMCVVGMGTKADAALIIDFDNLVFDGGTVTQSGGNWTGTDVIFDSIFLRDTTLMNTIAGVQCGATNTGTGAASAAETCKLNFNTATNVFTVTSPNGLYGVGADLLPYSTDRGGLVAAAGSTVVSGSFTSFGGIGGVVFGASGIDSKNAALLQFFGIAANTNFVFANTEIYMSADGHVSEADLTNMAQAQVPEPASMALVGLGLMGFGAVSRRRRAQ
jgi:hypothetical protein